MYSWVLEMVVSTSDSALFEADDKVDMKGCLKDGAGTCSVLKV